MWLNNLSIRENFLIHLYLFCFQYLIIARKDQVIKTSFLFKKYYALIRAGSRKGVLYLRYNPNLYTS